jgi:2-dehydropantoate 2-reductase
VEVSSWFRILLKTSGDGTMNIGVIGVGGVGGYFGGKICRNVQHDGANVFFVARGKHLDEIRRNGLRVSTSEEGEWTAKPTLATDRIGNLPVLDICLLCVKSYDLKEAVRLLRNRVSESTLILPLLNGIDICERIREDLHAAYVLPACVYVGTHIEGYGRIVQDGGACRILFGNDTRFPSASLDPLLALLTASGIKHEWFENVYPEIWGKFIFIAAFGLVTACFDKTLGEIMASKGLSDYVLSVMDEVARLAKRAGVDLPEAVVSNSYKKGGTFPFETRTSFQRDVESTDKPDERDSFAGAIVRLGKRFGVGTPVTEDLSRLLNDRKPLRSGTAGV